MLLENELAEYIHIMPRDKGPTISDDGEFVCHLSNCSRDKEWNQHSLHWLTSVNPERDSNMIQYLKDVIKNDADSRIILITSELDLFITFRLNRESPIGVLEVMEPFEDTNV